MKTDTLFYELFQAAPQTFFELLQVTPTCPYRFESITVKTSEKRIDGVLEPTQAGAMIYFLEVQDSEDHTIYWREMREVSTYFEQRPHLKDHEWQATVLWLNKKDDPGFGTLQSLARKPKPRLVSISLVQLLKKLPETSLALNVLRPLIAKNEREVRQNVVQWVKNIQQTPDLGPTVEERLISVMSQLVEQKFKTLSYKELTQMLRLTPLRETGSVMEVRIEDHIEIVQRLIQRKFAFSPDLTAALGADLQKLDLADLKALIDQILDIATFEQLEIWITDHLSQDAT